MILIIKYSIPIEIQVTLEILSTLIQHFNRKHTFQKNYLKNNKLISINYKTLIKKQQILIKYFISFSIIIILIDKSLPLSGMAKNC